jgi:hypothetical protein
VLSNARPRQGRHMDVCDHFTATHPAIELSLMHVALLLHPCRPRSATRWVDVLVVPTLHK